MSKYGDIETIDELITCAMCTGFSYDHEDVMRASDIILNTPYDELARYANDKETHSTFYMILWNIWDFERVADFWNKYTNPDHKAMLEIQSKLTAEMEEHSRTKEALGKEIHEHAETKKKYLFEVSCVNKAWEEAVDLQEEIHNLNMTIIELKAKLYDMMTEKEK